MGISYSAIPAVMGQSYFIPKPTLTEKTLPNQSGKVFIITGSNTGVGYQVAKILYAYNGTIYVAARTESKALPAIETIRKAHPNSTGKLHFLKLDLSDLSAIKASAEEFMSKESRLDWLDNNAGVMIPPTGSKSAQGYELQHGTNVLGPFLLTKLLLPVLRATAQGKPRGSVRVSWASSSAQDLYSPIGGAAFNQDGSLKDASNANKTGFPAYGVTKAANYLLAVEFGKRFGNKDGVLHNSYNPGNLHTELQRHTGSIGAWMSRNLLYPSIFGAYTELFAGLGEQLTIESDQGAYVVPWGRVVSPRHDLLQAYKPGGTAEQMYDWCDRETRQYS